jgi:hypothetical protein
MIQPIVLALGAQLLMPVADSVPILNVDQVCLGIAQQGGVTFRDPAVQKEKENCIKSEQGMREEIVKQWSSFAPADRVSCENESRMGGESSYTELLTCLEMARDVRKLRTQPKDALEASPPGSTPAEVSPSTPPASPAKRKK